MRIAPEYEGKIRELVGEHRLQIGPYYCQPDWQLTTGELLVRNLVYGQKDLATYGGEMHTGWMVDTFGHIGQSPQIHQMFGIDALFVWRGVPELEPYFTWQGADGSELLTINLFGGYRNLYGVSHAPEVAVKRLESEVDKLRPFYPTPDVPLFDGYDLEDNPEDPLRFYSSQGGVRPDIKLQESTPALFATEIAEKNLDLPLIRGELNSGKFGATFPGVLSARTYLKIMAYDCERMLFKVCEPLAVMASLYGRSYDAGLYEQWGRLLLQNGVHDCICGVSIDQVHEKMEDIYKRCFEGMKKDAFASLEVLFKDFSTGTYAASTNPFPQVVWVKSGDELVLVQTDGIGIWPVKEQVPVVETNTATALFLWANDHYEAKITRDGLIAVEEGLYGEFIVAEERGDTYSDEIGAQLGVMQVTSNLVLVESSDHHALLEFEMALENEDIDATASIRVLFDETPLIKWEIDLDSRGTNFRIELMFRTGIPGQITAGMPYDSIRRQVVDDDLLPRDLSNDLAPVLLGQRELNGVSMFPFHEYVSFDNGEKVVSVLAKGIRGYRAEADGTIIMPLRRSVEWLTAANLKNRTGDAGPFFYVPDARCERVVRHELAVAIGLDDVDSLAFQAANAAYQNPPILASVSAKGTRTSFSLFKEHIPLGAVMDRNGTNLARFYNPTSEERLFSRSYQAVDVWGNLLGVVEGIGPKQILTVLLEEKEFDGTVGGETVVNPALPEWRVGENEGRPDKAIMAKLAEDVVGLNAEIADLEQKMSMTNGNEKLFLQHRIYVLQRESLEFQLSHLLNERKLEQDGALNKDYLYELDGEIAELGLALNRLRIKRRIYDYVVEVVRNN
jgi:alpha-mannosidase